jgi:MOSC domain-containing protein YiiM
MTKAKVLGLAVGTGSVKAPIHRETRDSIELVAGKGIVGDKTFGRSEYRHVNLLCARSYAWFEANFGRKRALPGGMGEQVVLSDEVDAAWLNLGDRLKIGSAVLEVVTPRTPCESFTSAVEGGKVSHFVGHVGLMCGVVGSGVIKTGDSAELIPAAR